MFTCPSCSAEYNDNLSFCPKDGHKLTSNGNTNKLSLPPSIMNKKTAQMLGASTRFEIREELDTLSVPMKYRVFDLELDCEAYALVYPKRAAAYMNIEKAKRINKISHINLVKPIAFTETKDGDIQAIYELINGMSLDQLLKKRELPELTIIKIGRQLSSCLTAFHKQNLLHTNLHPGNVMIISEQENEFGQIKVLNSLSSWNSEIRDAIEKNTEITSTLQMKMMRDYRKIRYQRPDPGEIGPQCDVYAIGMILAEMMLGKAFPVKQLDLPYEYMNKSQIIDEALSNMDHRLPTGFREMINKCLSLDTKTYQNAGELVNELVSMERSTSLYVTNPINNSNSQKPISHSTGEIHSNPSEQNNKQLFPKSIAVSLTLALALGLPLAYYEFSKTTQLPFSSPTQSPTPLTIPTSTPNPSTSVTPLQALPSNSIACSEQSKAKIQGWYSEGLKAIEKGIVLEPPENSAKYYYDSINQECPAHPLRQSLEDEMILYYLRKGDLAQTRGNKDYACFWYNRGLLINKNNDLVKEKIKLCQ